MLENFKMSLFRKTVIVSSKIPYEIRKTQGISLFKTLLHNFYVKLKIMLHNKSNETQHFKPNYS